MLIVLLQRSGLAIPSDTNTIVLRRGMTAKQIETEAKTKQDATLAEDIVVKVLGMH